MLQHFTQDKLNLKLPQLFNQQQVALCTLQLISSHRHQLLQQHPDMVTKTNLTAMEVDTNKTKTPTREEVAIKAITAIIKEAIKAEHRATPPQVDKVDTREETTTILATIPRHQLQCTITKILLTVQEEDSILKILTTSHRPSRTSSQSHSITINTTKDQATMLQLKLRASIQKVEAVLTMVVQLRPTSQRPIAPEPTTSKMARVKEVTLAGKLQQVSTQT